MPTLNLQIGASANDAMQYGEALPTVLTEGTLAMNSEQDINALRFLNVTIPQGATITAASLKLYLHNTSYDTVACTASCEDVDNSAQPTTDTDDLHDRVRTTANSAVSITDAMTAGANHYEVVNVASAVQEVINRGGWASGNALTVILHSWTSGDLRYRTYDHDTSYAAKLDITYTVPVTGVPRQAAYYARMRL